MIRPPREVYVRAFRPTCTGASVEPGVEYRPGDSFAGMSEQLAQLLFACDPGDEHDPEKIALPVEAAIQLTWPDRAYFVEVHDVSGGWIQIFQPFGVPRNR